MYKVEVLSGKKIELIHAVFESKYYELIPEGPYFFMSVPWDYCRTFKKDESQFQKRILLTNFLFPCNNFCALFDIPYARHYNPRFVFFLAHFSFSLRFILQTIYVLKMEILHFLSLKSAVYTRELLVIKSGL